MQVDAFYSIAFPKDQVEYQNRRKLKSMLTMIMRSNLGCITETRLGTSCNAQ